MDSVIFLVFWFVWSYLAGGSCLYLFVLFFFLFCFCAVFCFVFFFVFFLGGGCHPVLKDYLFSYLLFYRLNRTTRISLLTFYIVFSYPKFPDISEIFSKPNIYIYIYIYIYIKAIQRQNSFIAIFFYQCEIKRLMYQKVYLMSTKLSFDALVWTDGPKSNLMMYMLVPH